MAIHFRSSRLLFEECLNCIKNRYSSTIACKLASQYPPVTLTYNIYESKDELAAPKPLVIVHGLLGHKQNWNSVAKALQKKLKTKVYTVDVRNHGESPWSHDMTYWHLASDLEQFITKEVLIRTPSARGVTLLGHSMGGKTSALLALCHPEIIDRLIIEDISPLPYPELPLYQVPTYLKAMVKIKFDQYDSIIWARRAVEKALLPVCEHEPTRKFLLTNITNSWGKIKWMPNIEIIYKNLENLIDFPSVNQLQYTRPTLIVAGTKSPYVKEEHKPDIQKLFPRSKFEYVQGSGHWIHADKPYDFMDIVLKFAIMPERFL